MDSQSVCMKGNWFRSLYYFIMSSQKKILEGKFQWFLYIVPYLKFVTNGIVDIMTSYNNEINEERGRNIEQYYTFNSSFRT